LSPEGIEVFVFDIYGEYGYELKSVKNVKEIMVEDTLFPYQRNRCTL